MDFTSVGIADRFGKYKGVVQSYRHVQFDRPIRRTVDRSADPLRRRSLVRSSSRRRRHHVRTERHNFLYRQSWDGKSLMRHPRACCTTWAQNLTSQLPRIPNLEFVLKLQHRSGGKTVPLVPTLADFGEGYNANVAGVRYRF